MAGFTVPEDSKCRRYCEQLKKKVTELIVSGWLNVYWGVRMDLPALTNWVFPFEVNEVKFFSSEIFFVFSVWKKLKKNSVWFKKVCKYERKVR